MNIKQRLFLSNILMIVIPLVLSLTIFLGGLHFYALIADSNEDQPRRERKSRELSFMDALDEIKAWSEKWQSAPFSVISEDVAGFNNRYAGSRLYLAVYKDGSLLTKSPLPDTYADAPGSIILSSMTEQALTKAEPINIFSRAAVHARTVGDYRIILSSRSRFERAPQNYKDIMRNGALISLTCSVFIILVTNRFLTRFVFKRIVRGMDILTYGVHQVRDGNLDFRIDYRENDEFSEVCGDFNEMAGRLLESVEARRKGEISRKELIAGISHDLRTPLTSIKAYVEGLEKGVASTPEAKKRYVDTIKDKTGDLEHIIDTLFLFSKLDTGEFPYIIERTDLGAAVTGIVNSLKEEYGGRGLDISVTCAARPYADIDVAQMRYVMINIFENSVKYKSKPRGQMNIHVSEGEKGASLVMSDDGPGVPEDALPKLFDVFYRSDASRSAPGKGSGLGLAVVAKMMKHFGGSIEAANAPGGGLSIKMTFPQGISVVD